MTPPFPRNRGRLAGAIAVLQGQFGAGCELLKATAAPRHRDSIMPRLKCSAGAAGGIANDTRNQRFGPPHRRPSQPTAMRNFPAARSFRGAGVHMKHNSNSRAEGYRQEAERLRQQAGETQNANRRIDLFIQAQHYDVLASTEESFDRRTDDHRRRLRYPPHD